MTGPEGGIGTDDCRYYAQLQNGNVPYAITFNLYEIFPFVYFLKILYPFHIETPLNVIIPNLLGIVFLPYFTGKLSDEILKSYQVSSLSEVLILLCPFTTYYGCILMRDMWIATFVVLGLYYYTKSRYINLIICSFLISFLRFGSFIFLALGILVLMREKIYIICSTRMRGRLVFLFVCMILCSMLIAIFPFLQEFSGGKLEDGLFRISFFAMLENMDSNAVILQLIKQPFPLNIVALTIFFFFLPFLSTSLYVSNVFGIANLFCVLLTPIFLSFILEYIIQTVIQNLNLKSRKPIKSIVLMSILLAFALATVSLQVRHKTVLFPFLCILAAYGICNNDSRYRVLSTFIAVCIVIVQLYMAF